VLILSSSWFSIELVDLSATKQAKSPPPIMHINKPNLVVAEWIQ
jgi:hypothetical protein